MARVGGPRSVLTLRPTDVPGTDEASQSIQEVPDPDSATQKAVEQADVTIAGAKEGERTATQPDTGDDGGPAAGGENQPSRDGDHQMDRQ